MENDIAIRSTIEQVIAAELKKFGNFTWAYVVLEKKSMVIAFYATNYPQEWVTHYAENNLQCTDPVVATALKSLTPFAWNDRTKTGVYHHGSDLLAKASEHNIREGYTFVLHDFDHNMATLSLIVNDEVAEEVQHLVRYHKSRINLFLAAVHEKYLSLASPAEKKKAVSPTLFTRRENDILYWASLGKTYEETGLILGIKTTTVKFHMANIVKKLGVANARHAICLGVELNLVKPVE